MSGMVLPASVAAFAVLGVAYGALWVWLGVRIFNRRERWAKWAAMGLVALPGLYALSSGPMVTLAFRAHTTLTPGPPLGSNVVTATTSKDPGVWWPQVYAPLLWASDQPWGENLYSYWELFPVQSAFESP